MCTGPYWEGSERAEEKLRRIEWATQADPRLLQPLLGGLSLPFPKHLLAGSFSVGGQEKSWSQRGTCLPQPFSKGKLTPGSIKVQF